MSMNTRIPSMHTGYRSIRSLHTARSRQQGMALIVALLLLVVLTLVGFAAMRGTIVQQKMSSNLYDREVAFQNAEAAMRAAAAEVLTHPGIVARNCQAGGVVCLTNPFTDPNLPSSGIHNVNTGTSSSQFTVSTAASGQPQFVIENMGYWADPTSSTGFNQTANAHNYNAQGISTTALYYRITARSGDPALVGDRAVVTLQAMIKRG